MASDTGTVPKYTSVARRAGNARSVVKRGVKRARRRAEKAAIKRGDYLINPRHTDGWAD